MGELTAVDSQLLGAVALQIDGNGSELVPSGWGKIVHRLCKPNLLVCRERSEYVGISERLWAGLHYPVYIWELE